MSNYAADDTQAIAQRLKEIEAEKQVALTGTSAPVSGQEQKTEELPSGYGYGGMCGYVHPMNTAIQSQWLGYDPA